MKLYSGLVLAYAAQALGAAFPVTTRDKAPRPLVSSEKIQNEIKTEK